MATTEAGPATVRKAPAPPRVRRRRSPLQRRRGRIGALYATPMAVIVVVLFVIPLGLMIWMSVNDWPLLGASSPNGLKNYHVLSDQLLVDAIWFTVKYTIVTTIVLSLISFGLALLVQERRYGVGFFRSVFFLPSAVGLASASLLFYSLFVNDASPLNTVARWLHLTSGTVNWLGTSNHALASVVGMITWRFAGFYMLILMTGLQAIDPQLFEAARTDGANRWQIMRSITLPLLRPTIALMLILSITGSLLAFDQFFILTGGRQQTATAVIAIYRQAFIRQDLGGAAAISVVVLLVLLVINGAQLLILRRNEDK